MKKKLLIIACAILCAILLVAGSVAVTVAYLTDTQSAEHTFTVGNIEIAISAPEQKWHLVPAVKATNETTVVTVKANSEACYLFVKVTNGLASIEKSATIDEQILENEWTAHPTVANVYYKEVDQKTEDQQFNVFDSISVANDVDNDTLANYKEATVVVDAYAIQQAGFDGSVVAAWAALGD